MDDYRNQDMVQTGKAAMTHVGPTSLAIFARLPAAENLLSNPPKQPLRPKAKKPTIKPTPEMLPPHAGKVTGTQECGFSVVGESHYQPALRRLRNGRHMATDNDFIADIITEPGNPHDKNACAIYIEGSKVGYLPRDAAVEFIRQMTRMNVVGIFRVQAKAKLSGGWGDRPMIGVLLNLPKN